MRLAGYFLLNKPLDPKNGKFPFIYFSKTRQESWGGLLGILLVLVAVAAKNKDSFTLNLAPGAGLPAAWMGYRPDPAGCRKTAFNKGQETL